MRNFFDNPLLLIILVVIVVLVFGANKLPGAARSLGRSMRIFKSEVKQMRDDDEPASQGGRSSSDAPIEGRVVDDGRSTRRPGRTATGHPRQGPLTAVAAPSDDPSVRTLPPMPLSPARRANPEGRMALRAHLRELRDRLLKAALGLLAGAVVGWFLYDPVLEALGRPIQEVAEAADREASLNFGTVASPFDLKIKISIFIGAIVSSPIWIYQLWAFVTPGLKRRERRYALAFVGAAVPLFLAGAYLAYQAMPNFVKFLVGFSPDGFSNFIDAQVYLGFVMRIILSFGLSFLVPIVLVGVNLVGLVSGRSMLEGLAVGGRGVLHVRRRGDADPRHPVDVPARAPAAGVVRAGDRLQSAQRPAPLPGVGGARLRRSRRRRGQPSVRVALVANPTSGKGLGARSTTTVLERLRRHGVEVRDVSASTAAAARHQAVAAVNGGVDALFVVGGDGMTHLGVNACAGTGVPLGIVAAGSGNDSARSLDLPVGDPAKAVDRAVEQLRSGTRGCSTPGAL